MKKITSILFASVLFAVSASAATVGLAWDANAAGEQVAKYTVYEMTNPGTWTKIQDVTAPTVSLQNVVAGIHTYAVTASNVWGESTRSNSVATPNPASPPANARVISIVVVVP